MKVTRDVIYDLLPGYFAGELSDDARTLVEEFFATDPEFARMAERFGKLITERRRGGETTAWQDKQVFERARSVNRRFSIAVGYTLGALLALFIGALTPADPPGGFGFLRPPAAIIAMVFAGIAIAAWIGWLAARFPRVARRPPRTLLVVLCFLTGASTPAWPQQVEWRDPSPHSTRLVPVDNEVQLEVLDWGGSGPVVLLLAGLGDTAHAFDDFAPRLTATHRVVGVTRRGHRGSSATTTGYSFARLAEDVVRVIDELDLDRPLVVGHSFAGEEMHVLGARHADRLAGLVYIDAAFNRADGSEDYDVVARTLPPSPRPGPADMVSFAALRSFLETTQGAVGPEAHLRARWVANADGTIARPWTPAAPVLQAMSGEMQAAYKTYNPEGIRVPALAIYQVPRSVADAMQPWYDTADAALRERVETLYRLARERFGRHARWFAARAEQGRVAELAGAHHLFISNTREVADQINAFASSLPASR